MIKNKTGSIVNIGSTAGILGDKGTTGYGSSKAALMYASKVIANEVGRYNIRVIQLRLELQKQTCLIR